MKDGFQGDSFLPFLLHCLLYMSAPLMSLVLDGRHAPPSTHHPWFDARVDDKKGHAAVRVKKSHLSTFEHKKVVLMLVDLSDFVVDK